MRFYEIDNALQEAIEAADKPVRIKIEIKLDDHFESVFEQDIIFANFYSIKEAAGGVSSRGEILMNNEQRKMNNEKEGGAGKEVRIYFSVGEGLPFFHRFIFYIDDKGFQVIRHGRKNFIYIGLQDLSYKLRKTDEARDWTSPAVFTYSVICDKTQPNKSLVHGIAQRAGLDVSDIDCSTIQINLPYVKLRRNIWAELSSIATAYRCHLECAVEKPLVFANSPYQIGEQGAETGDQVEYLFSGDNIFYLRVTERADQYKNTVRLKVNMPVSLEKQEIWRYDEQPVFYDEFLTPYFPFRDNLEREIENRNYEAKYQVTENSDQGTVKRNVVYADQIDTKEEAEERIQVNSDQGIVNSGNFYYLKYDITSHNDRAIVKIGKEEEGDLYAASIHGRPIVIDLNRSCFMKDTEAVERFGTVALNVTGSYFSEDIVDNKNGIPIMQYEDWVTKELSERLQNNREFTVKTHRALFNARVGAKVKIKEKRKENKEQISGVISSLSFCYKRDASFIATFKIKERNFL